MNAIELLKADHKVVDALFQKVEATEESEHPAISNRSKPSSMSTLTSRK